MRLVAVSALCGAIVLTGERTSTFAADAGSSPAPVGTAADQLVQPDEFGVVGRKVRDVVAEVRGARRLPSLTPEFVGLANDPTAYVDSKGAIFFADIGFVDGTAQEVADVVPSAPVGAGDQLSSSKSPESLIATDEAVVAEGVAPITGNPFSLNSRPGSTKTIYLDFDGETVSGTAWNNSRGIPVKTVPPYDTDNVPGSFSATEQQVIRDVWQGVAEDYAPFDVNVTTQRPALDALTRSSGSDPTYGVMAVITPENWLCGSGCAGVAYVDVFAQSTLFYSPAWAFPPSHYNAVDIANTVSHEVGHNLSLNHDGFGASEYYGGAGVWGPIMGNPRRQYVQWSKGEYASATNTTEDDVAQIAARTGFAADTSTSVGNAVVFPPGRLVATPDDIISSAADADYYAIDVTGSYLSVNFLRSNISPNLAPQLTLTNSSSGAVLFRGSYVGAGQGATFFSGLVPNGRYIVEVLGSSYPGQFTSYGSLGYYSLSANRPSELTSPAPVALTALGDGTMRATWSSSTSDPIPVTYQPELCDSVGVCTPAPSTPITDAVLTAPARSGNFSVRLTATDVLGRRSASASSSAVAVQSKPLAPPLQKLRWDETASTLTIGWGSATSFAPVTATSATLTLTNRTTNEVRTYPADVNGGSQVEPLSGAWLGVTVDASLTASTAYPSPWNLSEPGAVASVLTARPAAPSAPTASTTPRGAAPGAPGTGGGGGRSAAPQA